MEFNPFVVIDSTVSNLSSKAGLPFDQTKVIFLHVVLIPLGFVLQMITVPIIRKIYSITLGVFILISMYEDGVYLLFLLICIMYLITWKIKKNREIIVFLVSFAILFMFHGYNVIFRYGEYIMNITGTIMMIVPKFTYYSYEFRNKEVKGFLDYFCYCIFYSSCFIGPAFDYKTYEEFINVEGVYKNIKGSFMATLKSSGFFVLFLAILASTPAQFSTSVLKSKEFLYEFNYFQQSLYFFLVLSFFQCLYLMAFNLSQTNVDSCGLSFDGEGFNRVKGINMKEIMFGYNLRDITLNWNMGIQKWLSVCVYNRLKEKYSNAAFITFFLSAIWHGFYPVYLFTFGYSFILMEINKYAFYSKKSFDRIPSTMKKIVGFVFNRYFMHAVGAYWIQLEIKPFIKLFLTLKGIPVIMLLSFYIVVRVFYEVKHKKVRVKKE